MLRAFELTGKVHRAAGASEMAPCTRIKTIVMLCSIGQYAAFCSVFITMTSRLCHEAIQCIASFLVRGLAAGVSHRL
jgi:hypothetical protein